MKRPARLRIFGKVVRVCYVPFGDVLLRDSPNDDKPGMGRADTDKQVIAVAEGQPLGNEQDTVLHEVLHFIENAVSLDLPEDVVERIATALLAVLKDNPRLVSYLRAKEPK